MKRSAFAGAVCVLFLSLGAGALSASEPGTALDTATIDKNHLEGWIVRIEPAGDAGASHELGGSWVGVAVTFAPNPVALAALD